MRYTKSAFTLVELLVVMAVIAVLISILLPALGAAREAAREAHCLSNIKQLTIATTVYANDYDTITPAASYNNASGISPKAQRAVPGTPISGGSYAGMVVWDSIGSLLESYIEADQRTVYRCPSAFDSFDDTYEISGEDPYSGFADDDVFKPNYFYMSTALWINLAPSTYWYPQVWATRNIANVKTGAMRISASRAVAWVDESTSHHTNSTDIYDRNQAGQKSHDVSNFGYLDGHVAAAGFDDLRGYLDALGPPIPQMQFGIDFKSTPAWRITNDLPPSAGQ